MLFRDGDGGSVLETLSLQAAYCVAYHEQFVGGDVAGGAYQCRLTLSDPDGWTLAAGGPASALVAPAARAHGLPAIFEQEAPDDIAAIGAFEHTDRSFEGVIPSSIMSCIHIDEPEGFRDATLADLGKIYATPTGKKLLQSLADSGKKVEIVYSMASNSMLSYAMPGNRFFQPDGTAGAGTSCVIGYNPAKEYISDTEWGTRPAAIGLAHELEQFSGYCT